MECYSFIAKANWLKSFCFCFLFEKLPHNLVAFYFILGFNQLLGRFHHSTQCDTSKYISMVKFNIMNEASAVIVQTAIRKGEKKLIFEKDSDGSAN